MKILIVERNLLKGIITPASASTNGTMTDWAVWNSPIEWHSIFFLPFDNFDSYCLL